MKIKIDNIDAFLKESRTSKKLKLKDVSDLTNLSIAYISRIENGSSKPTIKSLIKLCKAYNLDLNDIVELDDVEIDTTEVIELEDIMMNKIITYKGKQINFNDKISILSFVNLISSIDNVEVKKNYVDIIEKFKNINSILK